MGDFNYSTASCKAPQQDLDYCPANEQSTPNSSVLSDMSSGGDPNVQYQMLGGKTHSVQAGDTLSGIARTYYGDSAYWTEIRDANPEKVGRGGDLILIGSSLIVPCLKVPVACTAAGPSDAQAEPLSSSQPSTAQSSASDGQAQSPSGQTPLGGSGGNSTAQSCALPAFKTSLSGLPEQTLSTGMVIATLSLTGDVTVQQKGTCNPFTLDLKAQELSAMQKVGELGSGWSIGSIGADQASVGSTLSGPMGSNTVTVLGPTTVRYSASPKPITLTSGDWVIEGTMGYELTVTFVPMTPEPVPVLVEEPSWLEAHAPQLAGTALIVGAGILTVVTLAEDVVTLGGGVADDPVSFGAAYAMFQQGMQAFAH